MERIGAREVLATLGSGFIGGLLAAILVGGLGGLSLPPEPEPGVVYAKLSVRCGQDIYTVSTGSNSGKCESTEGPKGTGVNCADGRGNGATMSCIGDVGRCRESTGAGGCIINAK